MIPFLKHSKPEIFWTMSTLVYLDLWSLGSERFFKFYKTCDRLIRFWKLETIVIYRPKK